MNNVKQPDLIESGDILIVKSYEEFDSVAVASVRSAITQEIENNIRHIAFDFTLTDFIDSSGIGICVFCFKKLTAKGYRVGIIGPKGQPKSIIELSQIDKTVPVFETVDAFEKGIGAA